MSIAEYDLVPGDCRHILWCLPDKSLVTGVTKFGRLHYIHLVDYTCIFMISLETVLAKKLANCTVKNVCRKTSEQALVHIVWKSKFSANSNMEKAEKNWRPQSFQMSFHHLPGIFSRVKVGSWSHPGTESPVWARVLGTESMRAAWQGYVWSCRCCLFSLRKHELWADIGVVVSGQAESWSYKSESINWELFVRSCTSRHLWGHPLSTLCWVTSKVCTEYFPSAAFIVILLGSVKDKDSFQSFQTSRHRCCSQSRDSVANPNVF